MPDVPHRTGVMCSVTDCAERMPRRLEDTTSMEGNTMPWPPAVTEEGAIDGACTDAGAAKCVTKAKAKDETAGALPLGQIYL